MCVCVFSFSLSGWHATATGVLMFVVMPSIEKKSHGAVSLYVFFVRRTERTSCEQEHQGKEHSQTHFDCWSRNTSELYSHLLSTLFIFILMQPQMNVSKQLQGSLQLKPSLICPFLKKKFPFLELLLLQNLNP